MSSARATRSAATPSASSSATQERYAFLRWGQETFDNFTVVPPDTGIVHQVNLEYLARVVFVDEASGRAYPDTLVGTDSHTTMVNGLGVLGWGVGGIEAEAAMLGQPMSMLIPQVIGFQLHGELPQGATATDLVLTVAELLRTKGVVGKFVEFYGAGLASLPLADRATIGNMSPEFGSTCAIFPIDAETLRYLEFSGRPTEQIELVEAYARAQGLWHDADSEEPTYSDKVELDLGEVVPSLAGPKRPQDRVSLTDAQPAFREALDGSAARVRPPRRSLGRELSLQRPAGEQRARPVRDDAALRAQPGLARPRRAKDWRRKPRPSADASAVAVTLADGHRDHARPRPRGDRGDHELHQHLEPLGDGRRRHPRAQRGRARPALEAVGQDLARAGVEGGHRVPRPGGADRAARGAGLQPRRATAARPASGTPARSPEEISEAVNEHDLAVVSVLSGNRNFEGRIHSEVKMNYLASPPLCVAYALAGTMDVDIVERTARRGPRRRPGLPARHLALRARDRGHDRAGDPLGHVPQELRRGLRRRRALELARGARRATASHGTRPPPTSACPPYFEGMPPEPEPLADIAGRARAGRARRLRHDRSHLAGGVDPTRRPRRRPTCRSMASSRVDFNSYGSRRGNHEVMMRGTFANVRLRNLLAPGTEGGVTRHLPGGEQLSIYDAAMRYREAGVPLVVLGGKEYGSGSSRDWAAKGTRLLGVRAVIAESFERIHRSNLVGMGVLPLQFADGESAASLGLAGEEEYSISGVADELNAGELPREATVRAGEREFSVRVRIDTPQGGRVLPPRRDPPVRAPRQLLSATVASVQDDSVWTPSPADGRESRRRTSSPGAYSRGRRGTMAFSLRLVPRSSQTDG